ncbi:IS3 family transposase [Planococcus kocurii]|uniref:IS3 family transposase n=1 Tax=Planococcus kocurii TaxID=1374 RepID=UPI003D04199D
MVELCYSNIKLEKFQYVKFNSLNNVQVVEKANEYMRYYNEYRILEKLGYLTPKEIGIR